MNIFEPTQTDPRPVTQGDLIQITNSEEKKYGIIVTGECDIAQGKFSNIFSYVELLSAEEYAHYYIILPAIELLNEQLPEHLLCRLRSTTEFSNVEPAILHQRLFLDGSPPPIQDPSLAIAYADCKQALAEIDLVRKCPTSFKETKARLATIQSLSKKIGCKTKCPTAESLLQKLTADPGDLFYVGLLPEEENTNHYIASLRVLREIHKNLVFTTPSGLRNAPRDRAYAKLVSRLTAPYRYRLTQKLAAVFSDIGLPGDFECHRSASLKLVFLP